MDKKRNAEKEVIRSEEQQKENQPRKVAFYMRVGSKEQLGGLEDGKKK